MAEWHDYTTTQDDHTVIGRLRVTRDVHSPQLNNERDIYVWLPPSYDPTTDRRYPVLYMHDGQNLFDAHSSFSGEWRVDETITMLSRDGIEAIIVGVPNNSDRTTEYNPFNDAYLGQGRGADYLAFIADTVKPLIDADFLTLRGREHTGLAGSSMGGLISLYGFFKYPEVFGLCGALSPAYWFGGNALISYVEDAAYIPGKIYMDIGTQEGVVAQNFPRHLGITQDRMSRFYVTSVRQIKRILLNKGYTDMLYVEEEGAPHHESAWARRLPRALRYLLGGR